MIITEAEAKKKWCPLARTTVTIDTHIGQAQGPIAIASANRFPKEGSTPCIGSACMAWREDKNAQKDMSQLNGGQMGYCGAFGRPGQ